MVCLQEWAPQEQRVHSALELCLWRAGKVDWIGSLDHLLHQRELRAGLFALESLETASAQDEIINNYAVTYNVFVHVSRQFEI